MAIFGLFMKFNNQRKRILIISFYYPPSRLVGGKRFTFLSQILQKEHYEVHVLTLKEKYIAARDDFLPTPGIIHRVGMYPPYPIKKNKSFFKRIWNRLWEDYLCLSDRYSGWLLPALIKGLKIIKDNRIDVIIATGPPFSPMVTGFLLSLTTKVRLILDYRDPWTLHMKNYCKIFGKRINEVFERLSVGHASSLVFCSRIMKENFTDRLGKYTNAPIYFIPNGFHNNNNGTVQPLSLGKAKTNMIYAGNLYGEIRIELLAKPLRQLLNENAITKDTFCFHVFGKLRDEDREVIRKYGLQELIKKHRLVPYERIMRYLKAADILFLPSGTDVKYAIPFKFYDYLSVKRPILAVAPRRSGVAELMREIDCGQLAFINSEESILINLRAMILHEKEYSYSGAQQYTWDEIGHKYLQVIDKVRSVN